MKGFKSYVPVMISILLSFIIVLLLSLTNVKETNKVAELYNVYIDGELIGCVKSKIKLENYINKEQKHLKEEYNVDKIYVPNGIDIERTFTYKGNILTEKEAYKKIKENKSFTIKGYVATISPKNSDNKDEEKYVYMLKKSYFDKAVKNVLYTFENKDNITKYRKNTQEEIKTTGSIIENVYIDQDISIKEAFISTDEEIFTNVKDLTKYLLFGSMNQGEEYTVKLGDTIETVAFNNKLSTEEFLIVNPEFTSKNNLLSAGQKVSISLISPILRMVVEKNVVEDMDKPFETEEKDDSSMDLGTTKVEREGENGTQRVTEKIQYVNGEELPAVITNVEVLKEPVNKVVLKGTKKTYSGYKYQGGGTPMVTAGIWGWPTISTYKITSTFGYRWGKLHKGIDISGSGYGSPIYSAGDGVVESVVNTCANQGSYSNMCGGGYGNSVWIINDVGNVWMVYGHMLNDVLVSPGQRVSKGQHIGYMGNSGSSTGTHLHFGTYIGGKDGRGTPFDPFSLY